MDPLGQPAGAFNDAPKDNVLAVQVWRRHGADEELTAIPWLSKGSGLGSQRRYLQEESRKITGIHGRSWVHSDSIPTFFLVFVVLRSRL